MKRLGYFLPVLILFILFSAPSFGSSQKCLITPEEALEKAKELFKEYGILYDRVLGPYLVLPHSSESEPRYLVYLARDTMMVADCWIDGRSDYCGRLIAPVAILLLDSLKVKEWFKKEKRIEAIFIQLVYPARFWGRGSISPSAEMWWVIDEKGDCYYVSLTGEIISFKKLADIRKKPRDFKIIED